jgi:hypothetical protein
MRKLLLNDKMAKTLGWALISGLLFFFSGIFGVGWEQAVPMLVATLTCVALKTPVYWLYEHGWDWAFHRHATRAPVRAEKTVTRDPVVRAVRRAADTLPGLRLVRA